MVFFNLTSLKWGRLEAQNYYYALTTHSLDARGGTKKEDDWCKKLKYASARKTQYNWMKIGHFFKVLLWEKT